MSIRREITSLPPGNGHRKVMMIWLLISQKGLTRSDQKGKEKIFGKETSLCAVQEREKEKERGEMRW